MTTTSKPYCWIVDLDGTVANTTHRQHFVTGEKQDWPAFFEACIRDEPYQYIIHMMQALCLKHDIVLCTGRPETYRAITEQWLLRYRVPYAELFMRPAGNLEPDAVVKAKILEMQIKAIYTPFCAIDDRPSVVEMWRVHDVPCLVALGEWSDRPLEARNVAAYHLAAASDGLMTMADARFEIDVMLDRERNLAKEGKVKPTRVVQFSNERSPPNT